jgi:leader peptidase (prepilin peptidase)/N-methyltransferase
LILICAYIFILGLILGSFFNVCIYRIPKEQSISYPPSHCTNCQNKIKWYDLIPVLSYVILGGKCRHCKEKISIRYPVIELLTAFLFLAIYIKYGLSLLTLKYIILASFLIIIGMIDFDTTDVYDITTIPAIVLGIIFVVYAVIQKMDWQFLVLGGLVGGGFIALIILLTKGMGWGDAEICLFCGLFLGLKLTILMLFLSMLLGSVIGIILIILKIKGRKDYIPFGPFIAMATLITILYGQNIIDFYIRHIL